MSATLPTSSDLLLVPTREAARLLSVSERTLWSLTQPRGPVPCVRLGRSVRYSVDALRRYLADAQGGGVFDDLFSGDNGSEQGQR